MSYNGWANWETWNVALWIGNEEWLYNIARGCRDYAEFQAFMLEGGTRETPDGAAYDDPALDLEELDEMIQEL